MNNKTAMVVREIFVREYTHLISVYDLIDPTISLEMLFSDSQQSEEILAAEAMIPSSSCDILILNGDITDSVTAGCDVNLQSTDCVEEQHQKDQHVSTHMVTAENSYPFSNQSLANTFISYRSQSSFLADANTTNAIPFEADFDLSKINYNNFEKTSRQFIMKIHRRLQDDSFRSTLLEAIPKLSDTVFHRQRMEIVHQLVAE
jgi:hypothetical protein